MAVRVISGLFLCPMISSTAEMTVPHQTTAHSSEPLLSSNHDHEFREQKMGCSFSCCRRRKRVIQEDEEPLLKSASSSQQHDGLLEKLADALAALKAGKVPSQEQINAFSRIALQSDLLHSDSNVYSDLNDDTAAERQRLVTSLRDVLESIIWLGIEKNGTL